VADELSARASQSPSFAAVERVYRGLRASHEGRKDHPRAGDFYFAEMEMRRLAAASGRPGQTFGSLTAWYGLLSGYGERWLHSLAVFVGVWLFWAVLYLAAGLLVKVPTVSEGTGLLQTGTLFVGLSSASAPASLPERYAHALLHSFLVATLIGRDVYAQPANALGQACQTVQIILGPLLFGLTGLAIRRRFQR
jgi:hypothetical protein